MTADPVTVIAEALDEWQGYDDGIRRTCQDCRAKEPGFSFVDPQHGGRAVVPPSPVPPSPTEQDDNLAALEALNLDKADLRTPRRPRARRARAGSPVPGASLRQPGAPRAGHPRGEHAAGSQWA